MLDLEKKIFEALEKCQLTEFKNALTKNVNLSDDTMCSMFNICMLEIDTKKDFAVYMFDIFGDIFAKKENVRLLDAFSNYWKPNAKSFYNELRTKDSKKDLCKPKSISNNNSSCDLAFLKQIKHVRNKVEQLFNKHFDGLDQNKQKIIFDVFTFLVFKCKTSDDVTDFSNNAFIEKLSNENITKLTISLCHLPVNFRSVLDFSVQTLKLADYVPCDYLDNILNNPKLLANKDASLALNIYLLRGKFNWVPLSNSSFKYHLENNTKLDFNNSDPFVNCWEVVLYAMYKSNIIDINTLKKLYLSGEIDNNVAQFFDYKNAEPINISNWKESLSQTTNVLLGDAFDIEKGINHVMLSVPFSQKQLLKMLITQDFDEKPCNIKLYSHWNKYTNNTLNSISKNDFNRVISDNLVFRARDINTF